MQAQAEAERAGQENFKTFMWKPESSSNTQKEATVISHEESFDLKPEVQLVGADGRVVAAGPLASIKEEPEEILPTNGNLESAAPSRGQ